MSVALIYTSYRMHYVFIDLNIIRFTDYCKDGWYGDLMNCLNPYIYSKAGWIFHLLEMIYLERCCKLSILNSLQVCILSL